MFLLRRMSFWFSLFSIIICFTDYWKTTHKQGPILVNHLMRVSPLEPFHHWMLAFDQFDPHMTVDISTRYPEYIVHFIFFLLLGTILDKIVRYFKRIKDKEKAE
jgi:hypothetical protein